MIVVLLGAPGSGKGTQGAPLAEKFGLAHVATGDMLREHRKLGTELGKLAQSYMDQGTLVPDEVIIRMVQDRLRQPDAAKGVILDGFPRTLAQAEALDAALRSDGKRVDVAPFVQVSSEELLRRLGGRWICREAGHTYNEASNPPKVAGVCDVDGSELYQRPDDNAEVARKRLGVYFEETMPAIDYYRGRGALVDINGEQSIDNVFADLVSALDSDERDAAPVA